MYQECRKPLTGDVAEGRRGGDSGDQQQQSREGSLLEGLNPEKRRSQTLKKDHAAREKRKKDEWEASVL